MEAERDGERGRARRHHFLLPAPLRALARAPPRVQPDIFLRCSPDGPLRVNAGMFDLSCHVCAGGAGPPSGSRFAFHATEASPHFSPVELQRRRRLQPF